MSTSLDWMISVDDHVLEPAHTWQSRVPSRHREAAPKLVTDSDGEAWIFEGRRFPTNGLMVAAGKDTDDFSPTSVTYENMRPGCYDSVARLEDMNRDGVIASLCFPTFPRFCGQAFYEAEDHDLGLACVKAYNDWMIEEWCGAAPGRYIPMIILPMWDPQLSAAEIERSAAMGAKAITFSENPAPLGLPSIHDRNGYWEPVFAAAAETEMPLCTHIGSSSKLTRPSKDAPMIITVALTPMNAQTTCVDWLFSGIFARHPNLKLCLSEGGIGWLPHTLEKCDYTYERHRVWGSEVNAGLNLTEPPSEIFKRHMFGCFIDDVHGMQHLDEIGIDNIMIETDYPHTDSYWPNSLKNAKARLAHRSDDEVYRIFQGNAKRVFHFEPAEPPATVVG